MDLTESKIFSVVSLGLFSFLLGILPNWLAQQGRRKWPLLISSLLCFGGGVLLSTSLIHILPELRNSIPLEYQQYTEIVYCCGFFILYFIDEIVHYFYGSSEGEEEVSLLHNHSSSDGRRHSNISYGTTDTHRNQPLSRNLSHLNHNPLLSRASSDSALLVCNQPPSLLHHVDHQEPCNAVPTANLGLLTALSVHALLEGLVVGLESEPDKVLLLLGAIASHKFVVSFCLGMELASIPSISTVRHFTYILIFSLGSSGGVVIGMLITDVPDGIKKVAIPILQALAGGTLLYVTVSEVLPRERARWHRRHDKKSAGIFQFFSVAVGFVLMSILIHYLDYDG